MAGSTPGGGRQAQVTAFRAALDELEQKPVEVDLAGPSEKARRRPDEATNQACQKLLDALRKQCPHLVPPEPLAPGQASAPVPVSAKQVATLVPTAIGQAVLTAADQRKPGDDRPPPEAVLWREGVDSLLVGVAGVDVDLGPGEIRVRIPVACDQIKGRGAHVDIVFAVGTPERPTGLLAATSSRPAGPAVVVDRWGDALTALAWRALLDAVAGIAGATGRDLDGAPLVPAALVADRAGIAVLPQARHPMDRVGSGAAVR